MLTASIMKMSTHTCYLAMFSKHLEILNVIEVVAELLRRQLRIRSMETRY